MAHECPECSMLCHCGGDIDDMNFGVSDTYCSCCDSDEDDDWNEDLCTCCGEYEYYCKCDEIEDDIHNPFTP